VKTGLVKSSLKTAYDDQEVAKVRLGSARGNMYDAGRGRCSHLEEWDGARVLEPDYCQVECILYPSEALILPFTERLPCRPSELHNTNVTQELGHDHWTAIESTFRSSAKPAFPV